MIKKTSEGFQVVSHSGKPLSASDLPYSQAKDRLREVEFFKRVKGAMDEGKKKKQPEQGKLTMEEMQKLGERQKNKYRSNEKIQEPKPREPLPHEKAKTETKQGKAPENKPYDEFIRLKDKLPERHKKRLNAVLGHDR